VLGAGKEGYDGMIKDRILSTPGVKALLSYSSNFDSAARKLSISAAIETLYGQTSLMTSLQ
jgi:hypothetical protein